MNDKKMIMLQRQIIMQGNDIITIAAGEAPVLATGTRAIQLHTFTQLIATAVNFLRSGCSAFQLLLDSWRDVDLETRRGYHVDSVSAVKVLLEALELPGERLTSVLTIKSDQPVLTIRRQRTKES